MQSATLANFRTEIARILSDPSNTLFDTSDIDQGLRQALEEYSLARPIERTYILDTTGDYRLTLPADFAAAHITRVEYDPDGEPTKADEIPVHAYLIDEQWEIETTDRLLPASETITIYYDALHTIDSLDSAAGSTVPQPDWEVLAIGAAGFAAFSRANELIELNNLDSSADSTMKAQAEGWLKDFRTKLRPAPASRTANWNDGKMETNFG